MKKLVAIVLSLVLALCAVPALADTLTMCTNLAFPPYEFICTPEEGAEKGYVVVDGGAGIDIEIAYNIAKKLGCDLEVVDTEFGSIIGGVSQGKYDFSMAGMTVTDERKQSVAFSNSYATGIQAIIVKEDSELTMEQLFAADASYVCGVQESTTGDIYVSDELGDSRVERYLTGNEAVMSLSTGKIDFVVIDNEPAKAFVAAMPGLKVLETPYAVEEYAACFAKDNTELVEKFNTALAELIEDGTVAAIVNKYIPAE